MLLNTFSFMTKPLANKKGLEYFDKILPNVLEDAEDVKAASNISKGRRPENSVVQKVKEDKAKYDEAKNLKK